MSDCEPCDLQSVPAMTGTAPALDVDALAADPVEQFHRWIRQAVESGVREATTVTFATVDAREQPDARTVLRAVRVRGGVRAAPLPEGARMRTVRPERVEFWQGSPEDHRHVRIVYTADGVGGFRGEVTRG